MKISPPLLALVLVAFANSAFGAQVLVGDSFLISGAPADQMFAVSAHNSATNTLFVVWGDRRDEATTGTDIYGQLLAAANGRLTRGEVPITQLPASQPRPAIDYSSVSDRFLVVFPSENTPTQTDILGQIVGRGGRLIGTNFTISTTTSRKERPQMAYDPINNRFLVAWEQRGGVQRDIVGQFVNANGTLAGENFVISGEVDIQKRVDVAYNSVDQQFFVVWTDFRDQATSGSNIFAQILDPNGNLIGSSFSISTAPGGQFRSHLAYDPTNNGFLMAWTDCRNAVTECSEDPTGVGTDIFAQRVNADGTPVGSDMPIAIEPEPSYRSIVAFNTTDQIYLVVWVDERNASTAGIDIFVQAVSADGSLLGPNTALGGTVNQIRGDVTYNPTANNFLITYTRDTGLDGDVYGQFVTVVP